ncbi:hypothetical protein B296_00038318 [Ensete ventricosum]|uniref:Uncharacterized protein n=1 Tax=Ensete ventricosum TaxID=4639 RepID=A0A426ZWT2_ENSVE|nr:hypothetical protein B296_00038318 [Ensete ventricosum]
MCFPLQLRIDLGSRILIQVPISLYQETATTSRCKKEERQHPVLDGKGNGNDAYLVPELFGLRRGYTVRRNPRREDRGKDHQV